MIYTGVGSRKAPDEILKFMTALGQILGSNNWTLRSGGAPGCDQAFERERGCDLSTLNFR